MRPARRRRALVAIWIALAVLLVLIATLEYRDRRDGSPPTGEAAPRWLLPVAVDELGALEIADAGRVHRFERDAVGAWFYHGVHTGREPTHRHAADPALAERIERTLAAFGRTRVEREVPLEGSGDAYGVATPQIVVVVYRRNESQPLAQYAVGHVAPDTVSRYVLRVGGPVVVTIPGYQVDNLLALLRTPEPSRAGTHRHP